MAEGFEPYHVPQQSRREKLRVNQPGGGCVDNLQGCAGLLPLYDPSLLSSDLLTCATLQNNHHHSLVDPQSVGSSSLQINPSSIHEINGNPFLFNPQNLRLFDQSFNNGSHEVVVYKPEPLSLSLSSNHTHQTNLPLELNLHRYESSIFDDKLTGSSGGGVGYVVPGIISGGGGGGSSSNDLTRSSVPLGPFTGYASILKGSRFLKPAQQLLEEICDVGRGIYAEKIAAAAAADSGLMDPQMENMGGSGILDEAVSGGGGGGDGGVEQRSKKSRLISMLDEVYGRYKYYYQQMQAVIASFESVAGLSNAAPYANLALKAMSKHFRSLKNAITEQLQFTSKTQNYGKDETPRFGDSDNLYSKRPVHNSGFFEHQPVWRPQRGLPERAVNVLRSWLFEHFLHPYPTDSDKLMLAKQTGLSRSQVSNWFINARVRLWKPMVEEIHMLETRQAQKALHREEQNTDRPSDHLPTATSLASDNPSTSTKRANDLPSKRNRDEYPDISIGSEVPVSLSYENLPHHQHMGIGANIASGSGGVSLTLGLHQNNGISLSEPFPINAARRFGLDANSERYLMASFEAQNRQLGRDIIGGQLLHDFVG